MPITGRAPRDDVAVVYACAKRPGFNIDCRRGISIAHAYYLLPPPLVIAYAASKVRDGMPHAIEVRWAMASCCRWIAWAHAGEARRYARSPRRCFTLENRTRAERVPGHDAGRRYYQPWAHSSFAAPVRYEEFDADTIGVYIAPPASASLRRQCRVIDCRRYMPGYRAEGARKMLGEHFDGRCSKDFTAWPAQADLHVRHQQYRYAAYQASRVGAAGGGFDDSYRRRRRHARRLMATMILDAERCRGFMIELRGEQLRPIERHESAASSTSDG